MSFSQKTFMKNATQTADILTGLTSSIISMSEDFTAVSGETNSFIVKNKYKVTVNSANYGNGIQLSIVYGENTWTTVSIDAKVSDSVCIIKTVVAVNDYCVNIKMAGGTNSSPYFNVDILFVFAGEDLLCINGNDKVGNLPFATKSPLYIASENRAAYTFATRLPYEYSSVSSDIERIKNKIILEGSVRKYSLSKFFDCSSIVGDQRYTVDDKQYYAIDNNTLMEV